MTYEAIKKTNPDDVKQQLNELKRKADLESVEEILEMANEYRAYYIEIRQKYDEYKFFFDKLVDKHRYDKKESGSKKYTYQTDCL